MNVGVEGIITPREPPKLVSPYFPLALNELLRNDGFLFNGARVPEGVQGATSALTAGELQQEGLQHDKAGKVRTQVTAEPERPTQSCHGQQCGKCHTTQISYILVLPNFAACNDIHILNLQHVMNQSCPKHYFKNEKALL